MGVLVNMVGFSSGRIRVAELSHMEPGRGAYWRCVCECGNETVVSGKDLRQGKTRSCGCGRNEASGNRNRTHGMSRTRAYGAWKGMMSRCYNSNQPHYRWYGAKGVRVCERWHSFDNFYADVGERPEGLTLDRVDPAGDYGPDNWRWATWHEQRLNRRM